MQYLFYENLIRHRILCENFPKKCGNKYTQSKILLKKILKRNKTTEVTSKLIKTRALAN